MIPRAALLNVTAVRHCVKMRPAFGGHVKEWRPRTYLVVTLNLMCCMASWPPASSSCSADAHLCASDLGEHLLSVRWRCNWSFEGYLLETCLILLIASFLMFRPSTEIWVEDKSRDIYKTISHLVTFSALDLKASLQLPIRVSGCIRLNHLDWMKSNNFKSTCCCVANETHWQKNGQKLMRDWIERRALVNWRCFVSRRGDGYDKRMISNHHESLRKKTTLIWINLVRVSF